MDTEYRKFVDHPDEVKVVFDRYKLDGLHWLVMPRADALWTGPLKNWREEIDEWLSHINNFDVCVQAGGAMGMYPRFWAEHFNKVITFEPCPKSYSCLIKNCDDPKFDTYNTGLGNPQPGELYQLNNQNKSNLGTHKTIGPITTTIGTKYLNIDLMSIDSLDLRACDLIHLDVEGFEQQIIEGAIETIKKFRPLVITERAGGGKLLEQLGYQQVFKGKMDTVFSYE